MDIEEFEFKYLGPIKYEGEPSIKCGLSKIIELESLDGKNILLHRWNRYIYIGSIEVYEYSIESNFTEIIMRQKNINWIKFDGKPSKNDIVKAMI